MTDTGQPPNDLLARNAVTNLAKLAGCMQKVLSLSQIEDFFPSCFSNTFFPLGGTESDNLISLNKTFQRMSKSLARDFHRGLKLQYVPCSVSNV